MSDSPREVRPKKRLIYLLPSYSHLRGPYYSPTKPHLPHHYVTTILTHSEVKPKKRMSRSGSKELHVEDEEFLISYRRRNEIEEGHIFRLPAR